MSKRGLAVLIACFCTVFTAYAIRYSYGVLLPKMLPCLEVSKTEAGVIYASYFIAYTVFSPIVGLVADRVDIRILLSFFPVILSAGTFLMSCSSSLIEASLFFALAGIGASACWSPVVAVAQRWVSDKHRGMAMAFIDAGSSLGVIISSAVMPFVVATYSWRMGWVGLSGLALFVTGTNFFLIRNRPVEEPSPKLGGLTSQPTRETYMRVLGDSSFWLIGLSYLLIGFSTLIPYTFLSTYAVQELMLPYELAVRLITMIGAASLAGKLVLGPLSDKLGRIRLMMLCGALVAIGSLGIAYHGGFLSLFAIIFGFGHGAVWPLYAVSASDYFPKRISGGVVGLWTLLLGIGLVLSPIVAGWIADATGTLVWSLILAVVTAVVSLLLLFAAGRHLWKT